MTIDEALAKPTISVPDAGRLFFNIGKDAAYEAARTGEIETIRIGGRILVPVAPLAAKLGLQAQIGRAA